MFHLDIHVRISKAIFLGVHVSTQQLSDGVGNRERRTRPCCKQSLRRRGGPFWSRKTSLVRNLERQRLCLKIALVAGYLLRYLLCKGVSLADSWAEGSLPLLYPL